ncbi:MAG: BtrH N-terminal domain-containing protein [Planctomycetota bacterium JB042]
MPDLLLQNYRPAGGTHPESATIANALAYLGAVAPHTGKPFSEELLFGIGGGIGIGCALWEFKKHDAAVMTLGFQHRWNDPRQYTETICSRLSAPHVFHETGGAKTAQKNLAQVLAAGRPAICWVDQGNLPYLHLTKEFSGCFGWIVIAYGLDEKSVLIDDLGKKPFLLTRDQFQTARGRIGAHKNRILAVGPPEAPLLERAVVAGMRDCVEQLTSKSDAFGLPALLKWAKAVTDKKGKKGWPTVFPDGVGLYGALVALHESICHLGTDGAGLRSMFADFLSEASRILDDKAVAKVSRRYRAVAKHWSRLAEIVLPPETFAETLDLIEKKHVILRTQGQTGLEELKRYSDRLEALRQKHNQSCPLGPKTRQALYGEIAAQLKEIHKAEVDAVALLKECVADRTPAAG